jgi:hypothetical protein
MDRSKKMYELASNPDSAEMLSQLAVEVLEGKRVNVFATDSSSSDTREYSDADWSDWAIVAVSWVTVVNQKQFKNLPWYEKALEVVGGAISPGITDGALIAQWLLQSSDTQIQELIMYRKWHDSSQKQATRSSLGLYRMTRGWSCLATGVPVWTMPNNS